MYGISFFPQQNVTPGISGSPERPCSRPFFLEKYPLVLTPFMPVSTQPWNRDAEDLDGMLDLIGSAVYVYSMNFLGLPAGNIGADFGDGMPVPVQIIGKRFREDLILDACEAIEQRAGRMYDRLIADPNSLIAGS